MRSISLAQFSNLEDFKRLPGHPEWVHRRFFMFEGKKRKPCA